MWNSSESAGLDGMRKGLQLGQKFFSAFPCNSRALAAAWFAGKGPFGPRVSRVENQMHRASWSTGIGHIQQ